MAPYIGEIRMFAGNFAPAGWMFCNGALVSIAEYETLFYLIGTTYGGDGESTFALPDLCGRLPLHMGNEFVIGEKSGVEEVTLSVTQIPAHSHPLLVTLNAADQASPQGAVPAQTTEFEMYMEDVTAVNMAANSVGSIGGSQPHTNMQPYLCVSFIISLFGYWPSQT